MLMQNIIALLTVAVAVSAAPAPAPFPAPQDQEQQCGNNLDLKCCKQVNRQRRNGIPINVGIQCVDIDIISVIPIDQQCTQTVACCQTGDQAGLVNVGNVCPTVF